MKDLLKTTIVVICVLIPTILIILVVASIVGLGAWFMADTFGLWTLFITMPIAGAIWVFALVAWIQVGTIRMMEWFDDFFG